MDYLSFKHTVKCWLQGHVFLYSTCMVLMKYWDFAIVDALKLFKALYKKRSSKKCQFYQFSATYITGKVPEKIYHK